jgi:mRNA interferase RelE/StbE
MPWRIELSVEASRELDQLDRQVSRRIEKFLHDRITPLQNPRSIGKPLQGRKFGELWRYRVGDYRLICQIREEQILVLVVRIGHRKEIYR